MKLIEGEKMPIENWESKSSKEIGLDSSRIEKLPEDWVWEPVKMGSAYTSYGRGTVGKVLKEKVYDCAFCRGSGERPRGSTCPVCRRRGTVNVQPPAVMCAYCRGRGEETARTQITCSACKGSGLLPVKEPLELCGHCGGRGKEPNSKLPCGSCRGRGVITVADEAVEALKGPAAEGQGLIETGTSGKDEEEYPGWVPPPSGSEKDALKIILKRGRAGNCTVSRHVGVSATYAEMVCNSLAKKGLVKKAGGRTYAPTAKGRKAMGWTEKEHTDE